MSLPLFVSYASFYSKSNTTPSMNFLANISPWNESCLLCSPTTIIMHIPCYSINAAFPHGVFVVVRRLSVFIHLTLSAFISCCSICMGALWGSRSYCVVHGPIQCITFTERPRVHWSAHKEDFLEAKVIDQYPGRSAEPSVLEFVFWLHHLLTSQVSLGFNDEFQHLWNEANNTEPAYFPWLWETTRIVTCENACRT